MSRMRPDLAKVKMTLCPRCPIRLTCPQFEEQLAACADAATIMREELPVIGTEDLLSRYARRGGEE